VEWWVIVDAFFLKHIEEKLAQIEYGIVETQKGGASSAAVKIGKAGEEKIREFVETRGLNKTWRKAYVSERSGKRRTGSGPGRIDSGQMRDAVTSKVSRSGDLVSVAMGWFNPDSDPEMPINFQEHGFVHENGEDIPGMNSLEDTLIFIKENIWSLVEPNDIVRFGPDRTRGGGEAPF
jgi:hypothetical protein